METADSLGDFHFPCVFPGRAPLPGHHSTTYPCGDREVLAIHRKHPLVLPCPVHGPNWAEPQRMHVILFRSCVCLDSARSAVWREIDVVGWREGHLAFPSHWTELRNQGQHTHRAHSAESVLMEWNKKGFEWMYIKLKPARKEFFFNNHTMLLFVPFMIFTPKLYPLKRKLLEQKKQNQKS